MESLRDIGYDAPSAVADLVDNSIDALARRVGIDVVADGPRSWIRVSDDGLGMASDELDEAMRYGSRTAYNHGALGHFGLGLKTASLSQCRRLTIASRDRQSGEVSGRRWDLDDVLEHDEWRLEEIPPTTLDARIWAGLADGGGTVVLWEHLDRLLPARPTEGMTARVLGTIEGNVRQHLEMVFHRFLTAEVGAGGAPVIITLGGRTLTPWDPFARDEPQTRELPLHHLQVANAESPLELSPYVLPEQQRFSSPVAHRRAGGPNRWNRQQGFYIYRRERLIQAGGWNRIRTLDEHAKLARIAVDLPIGHEHLFAVDVAKMRVTFPEELRPMLRGIASATVAVAQERYRDHLEAGVAQASDGLPSSPAAISVSRDWPAILHVVEDVLGEDPDLRDRLLLRLANADPDDLGVLQPN